MLQLWRKVWRFLKKLKIKLPYDPKIQLLGLYPQKIEEKGQDLEEITACPYSFIHNNQDIETTQEPLDEGERGE